MTIKETLKTNELTHIHGCLRASDAVTRLAGFTVNIWLIRFFASGVTVSHSGDGYYERNSIKNKLPFFKIINRKFKKLFREIYLSNQWRI